MWLNKKGDLPSLIIGIVMIIVMFVTFLGIYYIYSQSGNTFQQNTDNQYLIDAGQGLERTGSALDGMFVLFFILLMISLIISSYFIETHPVFFIFSLILFLLLIPVSMFVSNMNEDLSQANTDFFNIKENFPMSNFIFQNMPIWIITTGAIVLILLYMKRGG